MPRPAPSQRVSSKIAVRLKPSSVRLDATGRIRFLKPEVLDALLQSPADAEEGAGEGNSSQCHCNLSSCGG